MTHEEAKKLVEIDPEFIYSKRFENSLEKCLDRYPDGAPAKVIAHCLMMTEEEVEVVFQEVIVKLREIMKVDQ